MTEDERNGSPDEVAIEAEYSPARVVVPSTIGYVTPTVKAVITSAEGEEPGYIISLLPLEDPPNVST